MYCIIWILMVVVVFGDLLWVFWLGFVFALSRLQTLNVNRAYYAYIESQHRRFVLCTNVPALHNAYIVGTLILPRKLISGIYCN